jgi:hypothetical protein
MSNMLLCIWVINARAMTPWKHGLLAPRRARAWAAALGLCRGRPQPVSPWAAAATPTGPGSARSPGPTASKGGARPAAATQLSVRAGSASGVAAAVAAGVGADSGRGPSPVAEGLEPGGPEGGPGQGAGEEPTCRGPGSASPTQQEPPQPQPEASQAAPSPAPTANGPASPAPTSPLQPVFSLGLGGLPLGASAASLQPAASLSATAATADEALAAPPGEGGLPPELLSGKAAAAAT